MRGFRFLEVLRGLARDTLLAHTLPQFGLTNTTTRITSLLCKRTFTSGVSASKPRPSILPYDLSGALTHRSADPLDFTTSNIWKEQEAMSQ